MAELKTLKCSEPELEDYISDDEIDSLSEEKVVRAEMNHTFSSTAAAFRDLLLKPQLLRAISDCGFEHPSTVQYQAIPQAMLGQDLVCQAKSGMGKTCVFVLSILQQLDPEKSPKPAAIVLCHTHELAHQISGEFQRLGKYLPGISVDEIYGGVPIQPQREKMKKNPPHIVVGTPGRVMALCKERSLKLNQVKHFVLDECDKMLEKADMRGQVQKIFVQTPHTKQVMMFSATIEGKFRDLCKKFMHNPLEILINAGSRLTLIGLQQYYLELNESDKNRKLVDLLDSLEFNQLVIFVKSVSRAETLCRMLVDSSFPAVHLSSGMAQSERMEAYQKFKDFQYRIMVATNLVGRGIDIARVNVVINYDMPEDGETYLHRVGRAGRAGTQGLAISFVSSEGDAGVLNGVQSRFVVEIGGMPDEIDPHTYM